MTDEEVEKIIRSNMNLQMNLAGIRVDFEEKLKRTWVGLTDDEIVLIVAECAASHQHTDIHFAKAIEAKLKEKNT